MAFDLWEPSINPSVGSGKDTDQRVLEAEFGDGYSQHLEDGLNATVDMPTLKWSMLDEARYLEIDAFWRSKGKVTPFRYQLPGESTIKQWKFAERLSVTYPGPALYAVAVTLKQSFDLG